MDLIERKERDTYFLSICFILHFPDGTVVKNPPANSGDVRDTLESGLLGEISVTSDTQMTPP